ncbi:MAG: PAS domain S-box protein [Akkermansiaceae bacterium]|nr:PAS domain S-box protein [Verrucomicrobiales bacterium]
MKSNYVVFRLSIAFGCLLLILVGVGWLGIGRMAGMNEDVSDMINQEWKHSELSREALRLSSANNRITMAVFLVNDRGQTKALLEERARNSNSISELLNRIEETIQSPEEESLLQTVRARRTPYVEGYKRALRLLFEEGKAEEARLLMVNEILPLLIAYHEAWEHFLQFQGEEIHKTSSQMEDRFLTARKQVVALLVLGILLGGSIAVFVTRSLIREIEFRQRAETLQLARDQLEGRVAQRTSELSDANAELSRKTAELSAAHVQIQASEERFRTLSESAPMGIFLTDAAGAVLYSNPECERYSRVPTAEAGVEGWMRSIHPNDLPGVKAIIKKCAGEGSDSELEFRFVSADGHERWVQCRTTVLRSETGHPAGRVGTVQDITEQKHAEAELERIHRQLIKASREAGIAEVATGVLHNVKNVINSINVSASTIAEQLKRSKSSSLTRVTALLREHAADLGAYITEDPKGKLLPRFLEQLDEQLESERTAVLKELQQFEKNVQHVKEVVVLQQSYARLGGTTEKTRPVDLMEDALRINLSALARSGVKVVREYAADLPEIMVEKHKVLQILVNFIRNAKHACQAFRPSGGELIVRAAQEGEFVHFTVIDNGIGIPTTNLGRLFEHGFTTKKDGHGFGLHSGAIAAREISGSIQVHSDGPGTGATFTLRLPVNPPEAAARETPKTAASVGSV